MATATFGPFVLDTVRRHLMESDRSVHLPLKSFQLLEYLVKEAPRAVPRQELYDQLWGDTYVEEANLSNMISDLRSALGDTRSESRFLKTVHGFGYAFAADVKWAEADAVTTVSGSIAVLIWNGQELVLRQGDNVLGRTSAADLVIRSTGVSRRHALVRLAGTTATVHDLGSKNGTFVGNRNAGEEIALRDGDDIRLGTVLLSFRVFSESDTTRTVV